MAVPIQVVMFQVRVMRLTVVKALGWGPRVQMMMQVMVQLCVVRV